MSDGIFTWNFWQSITKMKDETLERSFTEDSRVFSLCSLHWKSGKGLDNWCITPLCFLNWVEGRVYEIKQTTHFHLPEFLCIQTMNLWNYGLCDCCILQLNPGNSPAEIKTPEPDQQFNFILMWNTLYNRRWFDYTLAQHMCSNFPLPITSDVSLVFFQNVSVIR